MAKWVKVVILHEVDIRGDMKMKKSEYLVDAYSLSEAEATATKELSDHLKKMECVEQKFVQINLLQAEKHEDGTRDNYDYWYIAKVKLFGENDKEKILTYLVCGNDFPHANTRLSAELKGFKVPSEIKSLGLSNIVEVFNYTGPKRAKDPDRQMSLSFDAPHEDSYAAMTDIDPNDNPEGINELESGDPISSEVENMEPVSSELKSDDTAVEVDPKSKKKKKANLATTE